MKVLVTGGAGFIGANLVRCLLSSDEVDAVSALDDLSTGSLSNLDGLSVRFVEGSVLDPTVLDDLVSWADAVVHLAAVPSVPRSVHDPGRSHEVNATGTLQVLEAARRAGGRHILLASSSSVYGSNPELPKHEGLRPAPMSPYAASKLAAESYLRAYAACFALDVLAFRFFNVFGPLQAPDHDYAAVVPKFVAAALEGRPLPLHGDGLQTRDFTFVDSVTAVISAAVRRHVTSADPVNLAFGTRTSLLDLIGELERLSGASLEIESLPTRAGDVHDSQADMTRLHTLFPDVEAVPLREGLKATLDWMTARQSAPALG